MKLKNKKIPTYFKYLILFLALILIIELFLRNFYGFGDMVLIKEDTNYEYIAQPNQDRFRFGNHILYNELSMRSSSISKKDSIVILGLGDSVINGGTLTDQDSIATTIVENAIIDIKNLPFRLYNISAGSWGPDNCAAYIKKHGNFRAKAAFLFVSSHDAYDNMNFEKIVGISENFPNKQYFSAISELCIRYIFPRYFLPLFNTFKVHKSGEQKVLKLDLGINKNGEKFNTGFKDLYEYF